MATVNEHQFSESEIFGISRAARLELARRYAKKKDILNWGKILFQEKFSLPFCMELHQYLVEIRGEQLTDTEAPRNHAKTLIQCFLIPLFQALEEPDSFLHYLNVQASFPKGIDVNRSMKIELESNPLLRELYGNQIGDRWSERQFVLKNGVIFTAIGAGQSIRGINYRNVRPDFIVVDDLYDEDDINNPESTQKKNDWFWGSLYPARAKSKRWSVHIQGTAINQTDLLEEMKTKPGIKSRTFQAITDWEKRKVLWPELNSFKSLEQDRENMGSVIFNRELQNERRDDASAIVKEAWLSDWEYEPYDLRRQLFKKDSQLRLVSVVLSCDPSIGEKNENDYTGMALTIETRWVDAKESEYWIEGLWNEHLSQNERIMKIQEIADAQDDRFKIKRAHIEGIAGFKDFVAEVRRRTNVTVREIDKVPDKMTNLENKSHHFENKKVHLSKRIEKRLKDIIRHQLTTNHPKYDDLRDGVLLILPQAKRREPKLWVIE